MEIRRAMPVVKTADPEASRAFYEGFLGFRVAMEEDGMLMLASTTTPTTQILVAWESETASDPRVLDVDLGRGRRCRRRAHGGAGAGPGDRLPDHRRALGHPPLLRPGPERAHDQRRRPHRRASGLGRTITAQAMTRPASSGWRAAVPSASISNTARSSVRSAAIEAPSLVAAAAKDGSSRTRLTAAAIFSGLAFVPRRRPAPWWATRAALSS